MTNYIPTIGQNSPIPCILSFNKGQIYYFCGFWFDGYSFCYKQYVAVNKTDKNIMPFSLSVFAAHNTIKLNVLVPNINASSVTDTYLDNYVIPNLGTNDDCNGFRWLRNIHKTMALVKVTSEIQLITDDESAKKIACSLDNSLSILKEIEEKEKQEQLLHEAEERRKQEKLAEEERLRQEKLAEEERLRQKILAEEERKKQEQIKAYTEMFKRTEKISQFLLEKYEIPLEKFVLTHQDSFEKMLYDDSFLSQYELSIVELSRKKGNSLFINHIFSQCCSGIYNQINLEDLDMLSEILSQENSSIELPSDAWIIATWIAIFYEAIIIKAYKFKTQHSKLFNPNITSVPEIINKYFEYFESESKSIQNRLNLFFVLYSTGFYSDQSFYESKASCLKVMEEAEHNYKFKKLKSSIFNDIPIEKVLNRITIDDVDLMNGKEFEGLSAKLFTAMGYHTEITKQSGDQGLDVIATKGNSKIGIQAKCYFSSVGNSAVQEAVAGKSYYRVNKVIVVTNNFFTQSAIELAKANEVILWDRVILKEKLNDYNIE